MEAAKKSETTPARRGAPPWRKVAVAAGAVTWLGLVVAGLGVVLAYEGKPGEAETAPTRWPSASHIARVEGQSSLVVFVHPRCPCSKASLAELNVVMNRATTGVTAFVVFLRPPGTPAGWEQAGLWEAAAHIPHSVRLVDEHGVEAGLFGARTSGQTVLYGPGGELLFAGGITGSRGHLGDNMGRRALLAGIESGAERGDHPVFGCELRGPADDPSRGAEAVK